MQVIGHAKFAICSHVTRVCKYIKDSKNVLVTVKPGTSEIFLECYCVARKKPIRREKPKPLAGTLQLVCDFVTSSRALIFSEIGHNTTNIPEIFQHVFTVFPVLTVKTVSASGMN